MKKYKFIYPYSKQRLVEIIMDNTYQSRFINYNKGIYSKISKSNKKIFLYHSRRFRNSFFPVLVLRIKEINETQTIAYGIWRWHMYTMIIVALLFYSLLKVVVGGILSNNVQNIISAIFPALFILLVCVIGTYIEINNAQKIISFLKSLETDEIIHNLSHTTKY